MSVVSWVRIPCPGCGHEISFMSHDESGGEWSLEEAPVAAIVECAGHAKAERCTSCNRRVKIAVSLMAWPEFTHETTFRIRKEIE